MDPKIEAPEEAGTSQRGYYPGPAEDMMEPKIEPLEHFIPEQEPKPEPHDDFSTTKLESNEMQWTQPKIEPIDDFQTDYSYPVDQKPDIHSQYCAQYSTSDSQNVIEYRSEPPHYGLHNLPKTEPVDDFGAYSNPSSFFDPADQKPEIRQPSGAGYTGNPYEKYRSNLKYQAIDNKQPSTSSQALGTASGSIDESINHVVMNYIPAPAVRHEMQTPQGTRKCPLCLRIQRAVILRPVTSKNDLTVMIVAQILKLCLTMDQGKDVLIEKDHFVCFNHFKDSVATLNTRSPYRKEVRDVVNQLRPRINYKDFMQAICDLDEKIRRSRDQVPDFIPKLVRKEPPIEKHCSLCSKKQQLSAMEAMTNVDHVLVIIIGCILEETYSIGQAQIFLQLVHKCYICQEHFPTACQEICEFLEIQNVSDIYKCNLTQLGELMSIVNRLIPNYGSVKFRLIVTNFSKKYKEIIGKTAIPAVAKQVVPASGPAPAPAPRKSVSKNPDWVELQKQKFRAAPYVNRAQNKSHLEFLQCTLCLELKKPKKLRNVLYADRLVIMVGYVLLGKYSASQIQSLMKQTTERNVCPSHLPEALNGIFRVLNIDSIANIQNSSIDDIGYVMQVVDSLSNGPQSSHHDFFRILETFCGRHSDILSRLGR